MDLITAIKNNKLELVKGLINFPAHYPPLFVAIAAKDVAMVKLLIEYGADVNIDATECDCFDCCSETFDRTDEPLTALSFAYKHKNNEIIKLLLAHGAHE